MIVQHDARGEGVVEVGWIDPSVGKPQRAKIGVTDSRGAVPTKDERRTDRLSMMNWLTKAPRKLGIGCGRCRTRRTLRKREERHRSSDLSLKRGEASRVVEQEGAEKRAATEALPDRASEREEGKELSNNGRASN